MLWDWTNGFSSLSEKTRKSNRLQMSLQRQHLLLSYLKTLSVGPAGARTRDLPLSRPVLSQLSKPGSGRLLEVPTAGLWLGKLWCFGWAVGLWEVVGHGGSSPFSYLLSSATVQIPVHTTPKCGTEPIRYLMLHFQDRRGATLAHYTAKSRHNHRFYVWTEALFGIVFVPLQKLSGIAWT